MGFDPYTSDEDASKLGLLGPKILGSARLMHTRDLAKQMLTGGAGVGILHSGGVVPRDGVYELEKGETVIPAPGATAGSLNQARAQDKARMRRQYGL